MHHDVEDDRNLNQLASTSVEALMTDASRVACVNPDHSLEHALLMLIKSGYSAIPVLSRDEEVVGVISKTLILDQILGLERIEFDQLDGLHVRDAMNEQVQRITTEDSFLRAMELCINAPFLCVVDREGRFNGIVTRRAMLSTLYRHLKPGLRMAQAGGTLE